MENSCAMAHVDSKINPAIVTDLNIIILVKTRRHIGECILLTCLPCLPSTALPASGSLGIISALNFGTPLSFDSTNVEKNSGYTILNSRYLYRVSKVTVNKSTVLEVENTDQGITVADKSFHWDIA